MRTFWYILIGGLACIGLSSFSQPQKEIAQQVINLSATGRDIANSISYSPDGEELAVGTSSGVSIYDMHSSTRKQYINTGGWVRSVAYSPDGKTIAAGLFDGTARFWRRSDGQEILVIAGHRGWVRSVAFNQDGMLFATAADDDTIRLWDASTGSLKLAITDLPGVRVIAFSPDGQFLAAGLQDMSIRLLNASDGGLVTSLKGHTDWVRSLAFSPDGKTLASGAFDATAILWDVTSGRLMYSLVDHQSSVLGVSFSPDGKTLASGSVDTTVKLWNVADGSLIRTLVGHTDFVYSVAFSPDGTTVASGSSDNSIHLWDISDPVVGAFPQSATSSDCRDCHHPRGTGAPPRVIQVSCEVCHANGIGLNWCPFFPRSAKATSEVVYVPPADPVGVPVSSENIAVQINYPTNGETLYSTAYSLSPVFVAGRVFYDGDQSDINIRMEIWSGGQLTGQLLTQPDQDGAFTFSLAINPDGAPVVAGAKAADPDCATCHEDFKSQASFPKGAVHFVITTVSSNGDQAFDERWITVDTSGKAKVDVHVVDQESEAPIPGLSVRAATILYEWRDRYENQVTDANGVASLSLEALAQSVTRHEITIPPTLLNGYLYESVEPVVLELPPGSTGHEPVTIFVNVMTGQINGNVSGMQSADGLDIWAVHLPEGIYHKAHTENGLFVFTDLPGGQYTVFVDPAVDRLGYHVEPILVDLSKEAQASINIEMSKAAATSVSGHVQGDDGIFLPFGWITTASTRTSQLDPVSGNYRLSRLDPAKTTLTADVPGFYSQAQVVDLSDEQDIELDFSLVRRPETLLLPWGNGSIVLPSETVYEENQDVITIQNGWIWGKSEKDDALNLQVAGRQIEITRGSFAVEYLPTQGGWLYLFEGKALIWTGDGHEVPVRGGEMVALSQQNVPIPVPYDETVVEAFQRGEESPLQNKWEPTLDAQIRDRLAQIGISLVQLVTFVTYMLVQIVIVAFLIGGIYSTWKYIRKLSR